MFVPQEGCREHVYLDDLLLKWVPNLRESKPGSDELLNADFETAKPGATDLGPQSGLRLEPAADSPVPFFVEQTTSYGVGVHCLRAQGGGSLVADFQSQLSLESASKTITVDFDFFIRSDQSFPYMLPDPTTRSSHRVVMGLEESASGVPVAMIDSAQGTWRLWDGSQYVDSQKLVQYDIWNHLQIAVDPASHNYRLIVQPIGELPTVIGQGVLNPSVGITESLRLAIKPSATAGHISCYDNLKVTRSK